MIIWSRVLAIFDLVVSLRFTIKSWRSLDGEYMTRIQLSQSTAWYDAIPEADGVGVG